jgi:hypothetical protein
MKCNQWTLGLAAAGFISLGSVVQAEEATAPNQVMTALSSTTLSGYVDTSAIWKFGSGNANMPGRSYDGANKQDGFNLNVVKLQLEKPLDEGQWSAGYKTELLFGPDAGTFNTLSTSSRSAGATANSDFAIKSAYVAVRAPVGNGLDVKMGVFDTIIGYEVFDAVSNPNYSRSYGYFLEPTTYTGVLASYKVADWLSVSGGIADVGAPTINGRSFQIESQKAYMASVVLTAPDSMGFVKGASLYAGFIDNGKTSPTPGGGGTPGVDTSYMNFYAGVTIPTPIESLAVGAAYDYRASGQNSSFGSADYVPSSYANAVGLYASWKMTDKMKLNARGEYASGSPGTFGSIGLDTDAGGGVHPEKFTELTGTLDYALWANVVSRVEVRWDHDCSGGPGSFGGSVPGVAHPPGGEGTLKDAVSLAFNLIYKF